MADNDIHEGDQVSWNYGRGKPTGTVVEIQTEGKLEIESKGKKIHRNADPSNPAVHVTREGNDVVKRASELTKLDEDDNAVEEDTANARYSTAQKNEDAAVGDKRERDEGKEAEAEGVSVPDKNDVPPEQEQAEKETGKEVKKTKIAGEGAKEEVEEEGAPKAKKETSKPKTGSRGKAAKPKSTRETGESKQKANTRSTRKKSDASSSGKADTEMLDEGGEVEEGAQIPVEEAPAGHTRSKN